MSVTTKARPRARTTDPTTSHEAADSVRDITLVQEWVVRALRRPADDTELIARYRNLKRAPRASESGLRTRRAELVAKRVIIDSGKRTTLESGRSAIVWELDLEHPTVKRVMGL